MPETHLQTEIFKRKTFLNLEKVPETHLQTEIFKKENLFKTGKGARNPFADRDFQKENLFKTVKGAGNVVSGKLQIYILVCKLYLIRCTIICMNLLIGK